MAFRLAGNTNCECETPCSAGPCAGCGSSCLDDCDSIGCPDVTGDMYIEKAVSAGTISGFWHWGWNSFSLPNPFPDTGKQRSGARKFRVQVYMRLDTAWPAAFEEPPLISNTFELFFGAGHIDGGEPQYTVPVPSVSFYGVGEGGATEVVFSHDGIIELPSGEEYSCCPSLISVTANWFVDKNFGGAFTDTTCDIVITPFCDDEGDEAP